MTWRHSSRETGTDSSSETLESTGRVSIPGMFREWLGSAVRDEARHFDFPQRATAQEVVAEAKRFAASGYEVIPGGDGRAGENDPSFLRIVSRTRCSYC